MAETEGKIYEGAEAIKAAIAAGGLVAYEMGVGATTASVKAAARPEYMVPVGLTRGKPGEVPYSTVYKGGTTG